MADAVFSPFLFFSLLLVIPLKLMRVEWRCTAIHSRNRLNGILNSILPPPVKLDYFSGGKQFSENFDFHASCTVKLTIWLAHEFCICYSPSAWFSVDKSHHFPITLFPGQFAMFPAPAPNSYSHLHTAAKAWRGEVYFMPLNLI